MSIVSDLGSFNAGPLLATISIRVFVLCNRFIRFPSTTSTSLYSNQSVCVKTDNPIHRFKQSIIYLTIQIL